MKSQIFPDTIPIKLFNKGDTQCQEIFINFIHYNLLHVQGDLRTLRKVKDVLVCRFTKVNLALVLFSSCFVPWADNTSLIPASRFVGSTSKSDFSVASVCVGAAGTISDFLGVIPCDHRYRGTLQRSHQQAGWPFNERPQQESDAKLLR